MIDKKNVVIFERINDIEAKISTKMPRYKCIKNNNRRNVFGILATLLDVCIGQKSLDFMFYVFFWILRV